MQQSKRSSLLDSHDVRYSMDQNVSVSPNDYHEQERTFLLSKSLWDTLYLLTATNNKYLLLQL